MDGVLCTMNLEVGWNARAKFIRLIHASIILGSLL